MTSSTLQAVGHQEEKLHAAFVFLASAHETMTTTMRAAVLFLLPVLGSCGNGSYYGSPYRKPDSDLPYAVSVCYTYTTTYLATCTVTAAPSSVTNSHEAPRTETGEPDRDPDVSDGNAADQRKQRLQARPPMLEALHQPQQFHKRLVLRLRARL